MIIIVLADFLPVICVNAVHGVDWRQFAPSSPGVALVAGIVRQVAAE